MVKHLSLMGLFDDAENTAHVIDDLHEVGIPDKDMVVMTGVPYPQGSLGRHQEWLALPIIVLVGALCGTIVGLFLAVITPHLYRLDIGGHPNVSFPPTFVIVFVFTMMATIVSTFLGVLWEMDFPRFGPASYDESITDGKLAVLLTFPEDLESTVWNVMESNHAHHISEPERMHL